MQLKGIDDLVREGRSFLTDSDVYQMANTHRDFGRWVEKVARWIENIYPDSGLSAEWSSLQVRSSY